MGEREYIVWSIYKVTGTAIVTASSAREAIAKGLAAREHGVEFDFSEPHGETRMRAELVRTSLISEMKEER